MKGFKMVSKSLFVIFIFIAANAVLHCNGIGIGNFVPLMPSKEEKDMCKQKAASEDLKYKDTTKEYGKTCKIKCTFKDGEPQFLNSPKDTLCCDIGGVLPTGKCDGKGACESFFFSFKEG